MYPVIEIFGPTIQGEGICMGCRTMFVRLAGCDYRCRWCDTSYALETAAAKRLTPQEIVSQLKNLAAYCKTVTLTGGNPCVHNLEPLITRLRAEDYIIHVETQGSLWQDSLKMVDMINLSPKAPSSGMQPNQSTLAEFAAQARSLQLKIVILTDADYAYARELHQQYPDIPMVLQVCNEPGQDNHATLMRKYRALVNKLTLDSSINDNVRALPQLHVLAWGNRPGV